MKAISTFLLIGTAVTLGVSRADCGASGDDKTDSRHVFTTKVDWYKPIPKGLKRDSGTKLPHDLTVSVPFDFRQEATLSLGKAETLLLTNEQAARFGVTIEADEILRVEVDKLEEKIRFFQDNPPDEELLRRFGKREFQDMKKRHLAIINEMRVEVKQISRLERRLKPYLIKAVALQAGGTFSGTLIGEDLFLRFNAMGGHGVPMERCPIIAYLPAKPGRVYTSLSMTQ